MKNNKSLGVREIAKLAGVSPATVSRVLNTPEITSPQTQAKVLKVIEQYGYTPASAPATVTYQDSRPIAIFLYDSACPFYRELVYEFNTLCFDQNYPPPLVFYDTHGNFSRERYYYDFCKSVGVAGIVYTTGAYRERISDLGGELPIVLLDRHSFRDKSCYNIRSNHEKGMGLLVDHLYSLHHRKIGFVDGLEDVWITNQRHYGFISAVNHAGLDIPSNYIYTGNFTFESGMQAFDYFSALDNPPTAVIFSNDPMAQGFILRANAAGVDIPQQFSVCGYDASSLDHFYPTITSVRQDTKSIAAAALSLIMSNSTPAPMDLVFDVSLREGATCRRLEQP